MKTVQLFKCIHRPVAGAGQSCCTVRFCMCRAVFAGYVTGKSHETGGPRKISSLVRTLAGGTHTLNATGTIQIHDNNTCTHCVIICNNNNNNIRRVRVSYTIFLTEWRRFFFSLSLFFFVTVDDDTHKVCVLFSGFGGNNKNPHTGTHVCYSIIHIIYVCPKYRGGDVLAPLLAVVRVWRLHYYYTCYTPPRGYLSVKTDEWLILSLLLCTYVRTSDDGLLRWTAAAAAAVVAVVLFFFFFFFWWMGHTKRRGFLFTPVRGRE